MYYGSLQTIVILYHLQQFVILIDYNLKKIVFVKVLFVITASGILKILIITRLVDTRIKTLFFRKRFIFNPVLLDNHK